MIVLRLGYPALLLNKIMSAAPADTIFQVTYDIACKFEGFVKVGSILLTILICHHFVLCRNLPEVTLQMSGLLFPCSMAMDTRLHAR